MTRTDNSQAKRAGAPVRGKYADEVFSYAHGVVAGLIIAGEVTEGDTVRIDVGSDDRIFAAKA